MPPMDRQRSTLRMFEKSSVHSEKRAEKHGIVSGDLRPTALSPDLGHSLPRCDFPVTALTYLMGNLGVRPPG